MKKVLYRLLVIMIVLAINHSLNGQPNYTPVELISEFDTTGLNQHFPEDRYTDISFRVQDVEIYDAGDDNKTPIKFKGSFLVAISFLYQEEDSTKVVEQFVFLENKTKKFLISRQHFLDGTLHGKFEFFNLKGMRVGETNFEKGKERGISRFYGVDGIEIIEEVEYVNDEKTIKRDYHPNGNLKQEFPFENNILNGVGKRYYETGGLMEEVEFTDGEFDGDYKYFYPNNQMWVHIEYQLGKPHNAISNSKANGEKNAPGTLKDGNGTLIYYDEAGAINEIQHYKNGERIK